MTVRHSSSLRFVLTRLLPAVTALVGLTLLPACAASIAERSGEPKLVRRSQSTMPTWAAQMIMHRPKKRCEVGVVSADADLADAQEDAYEQAVRMFAKHASDHAKAKYGEARQQGQIALDTDPDVTRAVKSFFADVANITLQDVESEAAYWEKYRTLGARDGRYHETYKYWVGACIGERAWKNAVNGVVDQAAKKVRAAKQKQLETELKSFMKM